MPPRTSLSTGSHGGEDPPRRRGDKRRLRLQWRPRETEAGPHAPRPDRGRFQHPPSRGRRRGCRERPVRLLLTRSGSQDNMELRAASVVPPVGDGRVRVHSEAPGLGGSRFRCPHHGEKRCVRYGPSRPWAVSDAQYRVEAVQHGLLYVRPRAGPQFWLRSQWEICHRIAEQSLRPGICKREQECSYHFGLSLQIWLQACHALQQFKKSHLSRNQFGG
mmetsp:Transcript_5195/g.14992  ORF Transcript_5195/g.14992 Transcript_5195/m.14992 type:complete len:218 (+) Transcript_5195:401-1054(+)